jgi:hypothetical protein
MGGRYMMPPIVGMANRFDEADDVADVLMLILPVRAHRLWERVTSASI